MKIIPSFVYNIWPLSNLSKLPDHGDHMLLAALFFEFVYLVAAVLSKQSSSYKSLSSSKQASWCIHIVSQVFTCIVLTTVWPVLFDRSLWEDKLYGYTQYGSSYPYSIAVGYFFWDAIISVYWIKETGIPFIFHGTSCFLVFFIAFMPFAQYYGAVFLLFESRYLILRQYFLSQYPLVLR